MPRFWNFLRNSIIHFRMFLYLVTCFLRITVSLQCRLQAVSKIHVIIYPYLISEWRRFVWNCDRQSNETVTLRKHVTKYETCENGWLNFSENFRIVVKLLELTRFLSPNPSIHSYYFNFVWCWESVVMVISLN